MKYNVIGTPRIEAEYCDEHEAVMVIDLKREDGETGDVWIVAGVPDHLQDAAEAARTTSGYESVRVFGDSPDTWCPESFRPEDGDYHPVHDAVIAACKKVALEAYREHFAEK